MKFHRKLQRLTHKYTASVSVVQTARKRQRLPKTKTKIGSLLSTSPLGHCVFMLPKSKAQSNKIISAKGLRSGSWD